MSTILTTLLRDQAENVGAAPNELVQLVGELGINGADEFTKGLQTELLSLLDRPAQNSGDSLMHLTTPGSAPARDTADGKR